MQDDQQSRGGPIPYIRLGKATLYPIDALERWHSDRAGKGVRE